MANAKLIWGESATMASEAAVLGIPGIYMDNTGRYYTQEQEKKYDIVYNFTESEKDQNQSTFKAIELLQRNNLRKEWQEKRKKMLREKIDVSAFLIWFIENFPSSIQIIKDNPDYQDRFINNE